MSNYLEEVLLNSIEENTPIEIKNNRVFDYSNPHKFVFTLTKDTVEKLDLKNWFTSYEKEAMVSTAGIRGPQNVLYPHDTRFPINTIGIALATLAKALVLKEKYNGKNLVKLCACEVRYNSKLYMDIISRIQANLGITTLIPFEKRTIPIWLASFLVFKLDLVGAEYITSSHGISVKNATKDLNNQGSQFLPDESAQFVNKMKEILETVEKEGQYQIEFSALDDSLINQDVMKRLNNGIDLYVEYLKSGVAKDENLEELKQFNKKIIIDSVGGCAYETSNKILKILGIEDKFVWFNVEQDPFFHSIGKYEKTDEAGKKYLYDCSLDVTISAKDEEGKECFPVINSMNYGEKLANFPVGTVSLITDPDHDRLNIVQVEDIKNIERVEKTGVDCIKLNDNRILCIFSANQAFLMIMDFWAKQLKKNGTFYDHERFIVKTTASSRSWDEWAHKNGIKVINTPVGFKEIASVVKKIEVQIQKGQDEISIEDIFGKQIGLKPQARMLFAGEESGGMIIGSEDMIVSHNGRCALAMREKSAFEAIIVASCLIASLGDTSLYEYLENVYSENSIVSRFGVRQDISYYNESETNIYKLKRAKLEGETKRSENDIFYLTLAIAIKEGKITLENAKEILNSAFNNLNFENLIGIEFVGDGTYLDFEDKFVEIRPSGTDAKTKTYADGKNKDELIVWANVLGNWSGRMNETYKKFLPREYVAGVRETAFQLYERYTVKDADFEPFEVKNYDWLLKN